MRLGSRRSHWLSSGLVTGIGLAVAADCSGAQRIEYVITFDNVVVQNLESAPETPAMAHLDPPAMITRESSDQTSRDLPGGPLAERPARTPRDLLAGPLAERESRTPRDPLDDNPRGDGGSDPREPLEWEKAPASGDRKPDLSKRSAPAATPSPAAVRPPLEPPVSVPPGLALGNPSFIQHGFIVEAFWAVNTGTRDAYFKRAHFHPPDLSTGFEAQHLGNPTELHGIFIRSVDGKPFGLKSLRYRVTRNRQIPGKPISIEGFSNFSVNVLVARSFDPRAPIRSQFLSFPAGLPVGNDLKLPWWPLRVFGFELVDKLYLASSASVDFDNIVLTRTEPPPTPSDQSEKDK